MQITKKRVVIAAILIIVLGIAFVIKSEYDKQQAANDNIINWKYDKSKSQTFY